MTARIYLEQKAGVEIMKPLRILNAVLCCLAVTVLLTSSAAAVQGIRQGLLICGEVVIPSLFPFMVLAGFIARSGAADTLSAPLKKVICPLFKVPASACAVVVLSVVSGYPTGAALVSRLAAQGEIDRKTAARMLTFCVNAGPAMVVIAVGECMLGSVAVGWVLFACHIAASVIIGVVGARFAPKQAGKRGKAATEPIASAFVNATAEASTQMIMICGLVALFSSVSVLLPNNAAFLMPLVEVTQGVKLLADSGKSAVAICAALGFSGACVICQVLSVSKGLISIGALVLSRVIHAVLSGLLCTVALKLIPISLETMSTGTDIVTTFTAMSIPLTLSMLLCASTMLWAAENKN